MLERMDFRKGIGYDGQKLICPFNIYPGLRGSIALVGLHMPYAVSMKITVRTFYVADSNISTLVYI